MYVALRGKGGPVQGFECLKLVFRANGLDMPSLKLGECLQPKVRDHLTYAHKNLSFHIFAKTLNSHPELDRTFSVH
jgi:hypothetical protein